MGHVRGPGGALTYSTDLLSADKIACMVEQFHTLLALVVEQPDVRLSELRRALDEVGRSHGQRTAERLEEASRATLRSVERKAITPARQRITE